MRRSAPRGSRRCWRPSTARSFVMFRWGSGSSTLRPVVRCAGGAAMSAIPQIRTALLENLKILHLPAMRDCFEQAAQHAEKETLSYQQYLLELSERECESRRHNRIAALLRGAGLPRAKTMANFALNRR